MAGAEYLAAPDRIPMANQNNFTTEIHQQVTDFLQKCKTASIATINNQGLPNAANIQYVCDEKWNIYYVSSPTATHSQNITQNPNVAITIYDRADNFKQIHGLQITGQCHIVEPGQPYKHAYKIFANKYPFVATVAAIRQRLEKEQFYCITPTWLRWIDNRNYFGFKVEISLMNNNNSAATDSEA